jgi:hypothetical protein
MGNRTIRQRAIALGAALALCLSFAAITTSNSVGADPVEAAFTIDTAALEVNGVALPFPDDAAATITGTLDGANFSGFLNIDSSVLLTFPDLIHSTDGQVGIIAGQYAVTGTIPGTLTLTFDPLSIVLVISDGVTDPENCSVAVAPIALTATLSPEGALDLSATGFELAPSSCTDGAARAAGLPTTTSSITMTGTQTAPAIVPVEPVTPAYTG